MPPARASAQRASALSGEPTNTASGLPENTGRRAGDPWFSAGWRHPERSWRSWTAPARSTPGTIRETLCRRWPGKGPTRPWRTSTDSNQAARPARGVTAGRRFGGQCQNRMPAIARENPVPSSGPPPRRNRETPRSALRATRLATPNDDAAIEEIRQRGGSSQTPSRTNPPATHRAPGNRAAASARSR